MARFPRLITAEILRAAASPYDTQAMRVELKGVPSNVPYRLAGKGVQRYQLDHSPELHAHILDFPVSLWMDDRESLARDILGGPHSSRVVVLCVPWEHASRAAAPVAAPADPDTDLESDRSPEQKAMDALDPPQLDPAPPKPKKPRKPKPKPEAAP